MAAPSVHPKKPMPNLAIAIKEEVVRLSRKELRKEVEPIRKAAASHRLDLA